MLLLDRGFWESPMKHVLALTALAALSCPALAQAVIPPEEYDHPFEGPVAVILAKDVETVNKLCNNPRAVLGCARTLETTNYGKICWIVMAADDVIRGMGFTPELVKRHEIGHCNGWPSYHPGGRFLTTVNKGDFKRYPSGDTRSGD
jgi:hypothetical protein